MRRKSRKPTNPFTVLFLVSMIGVLWYFYQVEVPDFYERFEPTRTPTRSPESFLNEARDLYAQGKMQPAIDAYAAAIGVGPDPATYVEMARLMILNGQYEEAIDAAERALVLNSDYSMAYAVKAWALTNLDDPLEADGAVRKAIELDGSNALAYAILSEVLMDADPYANIDEASEASKKAKALDPDSIESFRARGYVLEKTGNFEEAIQEYKAALALNDKLWELHYRLGMVYYYSQDYSSATQELNLALSFNPTDPLLPRELAKVSYAAGEYGKAVQYAEQAVKLAPENPIYHAVLGATLYRERKDIKRASDELALYVRGGTTADGVSVEKVSLIADNVVDVNYSIYVLTLTAQDRCQEAMPIIQLILQNVPEDAPSFYNATEALNYCQYGPATPQPSEESTDEEP